MVREAVAALVALQDSLDTEMAELEQRIGDLRVTIDDLQVTIDDLNDLDEAE